MKTVIITGSTKGIGAGLAREFLARGCVVVVSGRSQARVEAAVMQLSQEFAPDHILGHPCDVTQFEQVQALWDAAVNRLGRVDFWINNAGITSSGENFWQEPVQESLDAVVNTNLLGVMYGSKVAFEGMLRQGFGQIYNMEGFGSDGRMGSGMTIYGATKYALRYFTRSLAKEAAQTPVKVCTLSPGMVVTDLLIGGYAGNDADFERAKRIFNILADHVETVTPFLAEKILANQKNGAAVAWLTTPKILRRFLTAPFNKRDLFASAAPPKPIPTIVKD